MIFDTKKIQNIKVGKPPSFTDLKKQYLGSSSGKSATGPPKDIIYSQHVPKPPDPTFTNFFSIITNVQDTGKYMQGMLIKGKDCKGNSAKMGNSFFVPSGKCDRYKSTPECRNKTRYLYINNVPQETIPCADTTIPSDPLCKQNNPTGLIPGVIQDVVNINPFEIIASAVGEGSIVNDKCELRSELVGTQLGNKIDFKYETRCTPVKRPLVCSIPMDAMPNCLQYDIDDEAVRESDTSPPDIPPDADVPNLSGSIAGGQYASEYTNKYFNTLINGDKVFKGFIQSKLPKDFIPPIQIKKLRLDKYDSKWQNICETIHNKFSIFLQIKNINAEKFLLKSCCMIDKIQCKNNMILYNSSVIIYRNRKYGFQLKWTTYYNSSSDALVIYACKIIGNPLPYEVDPDEGDFYNQIEDFTNYNHKSKKGQHTKGQHVKEKNNYILIIIILIFLLFFIAKLIIKY